MKTCRASAWAVILAAAGVAGATAEGPARMTTLTLEIAGGPELVLPGIASSEYSEVRLAASPDGRTLLWGSTDRPGGPGGWDIWLSRKSASGWSAPQAVPFDTPANEFDPAFAPDGRTVYFFSNRAGGLGGDDLYRVPVTDAGFGTVEHLGPEVNSAGDEWAPSLSPDGKTLLFATDGRGGAGRHDLFTAAVAGAGFAPARPLPGRINSPVDEFDATFLPGGGAIVFARSADVEKAPIALYFAAPDHDGYPTGTVLGPAVNPEGGDALAPTVDWSDPRILYFTSHRPEASAGKADHYRVRFRLNG